MSLAVVANHVRLGIEAAAAVFAAVVVAVTILASAFPAIGCSTAFRAPGIGVFHAVVIARLRWPNNRCSEAAGGVWVGIHVVLGGGSLTWVLGVIATRLGYIQPQDGRTQS